MQRSRQSETLDHWGRKPSDLAHLHRESRHSEAVPVGRGVMLFELLQKLPDPLGTRKRKRSKSFLNRRALRKP